MRLHREKIRLGGTEAATINRVVYETSYFRIDHILEVKTYMIMITLSSWMTDIWMQWSQSKYVSISTCKPFSVERSAVYIVTHFSSNAERIFLWTHFDPQNGGRTFLQISVNFYQTTQHNIPADCTLHFVSVKYSKSGCKMCC